MQGNAQCMKHACPVCALAIESLYTEKFHAYHHNYVYIYPGMGTDTKYWIY